jgi:choice-of-anchor A domain-containing protein
MRFFARHKSSATYRIFAFCSFTVAGSVSAATLSHANSYNVFVFENLNASNVDSEGRVAVGGNATLANYGVGSTFSSNPGSAGDTLVVGGNLSYNGGEVHYGNVAYGGTLSGTISAPNGTITQGATVDFAAAEQYLVASSSYWSNLSATGTTTNNFGGLFLVGNDPTLNIFTVSGSELNSAWGITVDAPSGSTVLVNVSGAINDFDNMGVSFASTNGNGATNQQHVLYNFYEATSLSISGISVKGSVLAPLADVSFTNGNIEGNIVVKSLTGSGEAHNFLFAGDLPDPEPSLVPEPSGWILSMLGISWLTLFNRRRQR